MNDHAIIRIVAAREPRDRARRIARREHPQACPECQAPTMPPRDLERMQHTSPDLCCGACGYLWRAPLRHHDTLRDNALQAALENQS